MLHEHLRHRTSHQEPSFQQPDETAKQHRRPPSNLSGHQVVLLNCRNVRDLGTPCSVLRIFPVPPARSRIRVLGGTPRRGRDTRLAGPAVPLGEGSEAHIRAALRQALDAVARGLRARSAGNRGPRGGWVGEGGLGDFALRLGLCQGGLRPQRIRPSRPSLTYGTGCGTAARPAAGRSVPPLDRLPLQERIHC